MSMLSEAPLRSLFESRCQTRREVAEVLCVVTPDSRYAEPAQRLREQYLSSARSPAALGQISLMARDLLQRARHEQTEPRLS